MSTRTKTHQLITDPLIRIFALGASNRQDTESLELTQPNESGKLFSARLCKGNFFDLSQFMTILKYRLLVDVCTSLRRSMALLIQSNWLCLNSCEHIHQVFELIAPLNYVSKAI